MTSPRKTGAAKKAAPALKSRKTTSGTSKSAPAKKRAATKTAAKSSTKKRTKRSSPRELFARGMTRWLEGAGYHVGLNIQKIDAEKEKEFGEKLRDGVVEFLGNFASSGMPQFVSAGAETDELFMALVPYLPLTDIMASKLNMGQAVVPLIVFADKLTEEQISGRFEIFKTLGKPLTEFGPRLNFQSMGTAFIFPTLVYFNSQRHDAHLAALLSKGWQPDTWGRLYLHAGFVNVPAKTVTWAQKTGLASIGEALGDFFGYSTNLFQFEEKELEAVEILARQP